MIRTPAEVFHAERCGHCGGRGRIYQLGRLTHTTGELRLGRSRKPIPFAVGKARCTPCEGSGFRILAEIGEVPSY